MRIAVVNDDAVAVEVLRRAVAGAPDHTLAWIARDGAEAVRRCAQDPPDVVLMDLLMPVMDGVEAIRQIMSATPCAILVVTGDVSRNTSKVFAALGAGAVDVVATPTLAADSGEASTKALMNKIKLVGQVGLPRFVPPRLSTKMDGPPVAGLIVIGASAGGPPAVAHVLRDLAADLQAAVLVVQHVDAEFVDSMADWFDSQASFSVQVAQEGTRPLAGHVYVSAGDLHLVLRANGTLGYEREPATALYRPSADVLFESVANNWRGAVIGVVLSGMGRDGAIGLGKLRVAGARTIAQDEKTSAVYGMPRAAAEANAATDVLALERIGPFLNQSMRLAERSSGSQAAITPPVNATTR
ncbi:MAG: chemotaxis-specific protein-glutamate methyltransferase CheB [Gemmatimonadota bacterium]